MKKILFVGPKRNVEPYATIISGILENVETEIMNNYEEVKNRISIKNDVDLIISSEFKMIRHEKLDKSIVLLRKFAKGLEIPFLLHLVHFKLEIDKLRNSGQIQKGEYYHSDLEIDWGDFRNKIKSKLK